jgi:hypothetical protein
MLPLSHEQHRGRTCQVATNYFRAFFFSALPSFSTAFASSAAPATVHSAARWHLQFLDNLCLSRRKNCWSCDRMDNAGVRPDALSDCACNSFVVTVLPACPLLVLAVPASIVSFCPEGNCCNALPASPLPQPGKVLPLFHHPVIFTTFDAATIMATPPRAHEAANFINHKPCILNHCKISCFFSLILSMLHTTQ